MQLTVDRIALGHLWGQLGAAKGGKALEGYLKFPRLWPPKRPHCTAAG